MPLTSHHPQCYPSHQSSMTNAHTGVLIQTSMEGTPPPRGAEKGQRQACSWKRPRLYLPVRRLALPVGTGGGPGGGSSHRQLEGRGGAAQPGWRLPPRESPRAQGQHKHTRAPPGCSLSMCPPTRGHLARDFSDRVPSKNKLFGDFQCHLRKDKPQVIGEFNTILLCCMNISIKFVTDNVMRQS